MGRLSFVTAALGAALLFGTVVHAQQQPPRHPAAARLWRADYARAGKSGDCRWSSGKQEEWLEPCFRRRRWRRHSYCV